MSGFGRLGGLYLVQQLSTLPREIVDNILDDLTLFKILQLATWADPVISSYILEHRHYGRLFLDAAHLGTAVSRFAVWCQVKVACGWRNDKHSFPLNPRSSLFGRMTYNEIMGDMMEDIEKGYRRGAVYAQLLSQFMPKPVSPGLQMTERRLRQHLQEFWKAQETIKELESHQLKLLADFLETYPDMLRWTYDPRGDASKTPIKHNITRLRVCARKVFNTQYIRERKPVYCKYVFRNGILPITPRNSCLQLLLRSDLPVDVVNWEEAEPFTVNEMMPRAWRRKKKAKDAVLSALRRRFRQGQALEAELGDAVHSAAASRVEDFNTRQRTTTAEMTDMQQYTSLAGPSKQNHEGPENPKGRDGHPTEATATRNEFPSHVVNDLRKFSES
jgi:hypothetical protein